MFIMLNYFTISHNVTTVYQLSEKLDLPLRGDNKQTLYSSFLHASPAQIQLNRANYLKFRKIGLIVALL